jgi:hypothetical protein
MNFIGFDDASQQIDQKDSFGGFEWREDSRLTCQNPGAHSLAQAHSARGNAQFARPTIRITDTPSDEALRLKIIDDLPRIGAIDPHHHGKAALIDPGEISDEGKRMIGHRSRHFLIGKDSDEHRVTDLLQSTRQRERNAMRNDGVGRKHELCPAMFGLRGAVFRHALGCSRYSQYYYDKYSDEWQAVDRASWREPRSCVETLARSCGGARKDV